MILVRHTSEDELDTGYARNVVFRMAEVAVPQQIFQDILRLISELRPQPPPAPAGGVRYLCIQEQQTGGVRPNAKENGQISTSTTLRGARDAGSRPAAHVWLPGKPENCYYARQFGSHLGNLGKNRRKPGNDSSSAYREEITMQRTSTRAFALAMGLIVVAFAAIHLAPQASGQTGPGWVTLLDGKNMGDWNRVGETNWRLEDGAVVADKRTSKGAAYLVSKKTYKDFQIYVEFWASHDANSGIFIRCSNPESIGAKTCYEVNIFDQRKDPTYGTGAIVNFVEVNPMPKAGGKWNTYEITAKGRHLVVVLNGQKTVDYKNGLFTEGPFSLQHGAGVIKFRKVAVKPL